jgi:transcription elongation factor Elf1
MIEEYKAYTVKYELNMNCECGSNKFSIIDNYQCLYKAKCLDCGLLYKIDTSPVITKIGQSK